MKFILQLFIKGYQILIAPFLNRILGVNNICRYSVTCSQYALSAIDKEGAVKGSLKAIKRIAACQPFTSKKYEYI